MRTFASQTSSKGYNYVHVTIRIGTHYTTNTHHKQILEHIIKIRKHVPMKHERKIPVRKSPTEGQ